MISGATVTFQPSDQAGDYSGTIQSYLNSNLYSEYIFQPGPNNAAWLVSPLTVGHDNTLIVLGANTVLETKTGAYGTLDCLIKAKGLTNVTISGTTGSTLLMHPDEYAASATAETENRHAISVLSCSNVTIEGLTISKTGGDGIYIGDKSSARNGKCSNVTINNVVTDGAARNGVSVISVDGLNITNCTFKNSMGRGNLASFGPWAGIDMEPNSAQEQLKGITIDNCAFLGNGQHGLLVAAHKLDTTSVPIDIQVSNSLVQGNKEYGIRVVKVPLFASPATIKFQDCSIMDHAIAGILLQDKSHATSVTFEDCYLKNNSFTSSPYDAPIAVVNDDDFVLTGTGGEVTLDNVVIEQTLDRSMSRCLLVQGTSTYPIDSVTGTLYASSGTVSQMFSSNVNVLPVSSISASYWRLDETSGTSVLDSTGSSPGVIRNNAVQSSGRVGGALQMDGGSEYAEISTNSPSLDVGRGDFSIALWFQRFDKSTTNSRLVSKGAAATNDPGYALIGSNTNLSFALCNGSVRRSISTPISALNQWNHVACTISRKGKMSLYLNGILKSQADVSDWGQADITCIRNLLLGSCYNFTTLNWPGLIDDVRVYNRTLSAGEVLEMARLPSSYWPLNESGSGIVNGGTINDMAGRCNGTIQGSLSGTTGIAGGALCFSGSGQYVDLAANPGDINIGKLDFTISLWFQRFSNVATTKRIFYKGASADTDPGYAIVGSDSKVTFFLSNGVIRRSIGGSIPGTNQWTHLACTIDRNGMATLYLNGKFAGQIDVSDWAGDDINSIQNGLMARCHGFTTLDWPGVIDDVRIYKRALSELDVQKIFMAYSPVVLR